MNFSIRALRRVLVGLVLLGPLAGVPQPRRRVSRLRRPYAQ